MNARRWLVGLASLGLILAIFFNRTEIADAFKLVVTTNWRILLLIPLIKMLVFGCLSGYYYSFLRALNFKVKFSKLYRLNLALHFVNNVAPSVGITGATFMTYNLRPQVPAGKTTLVEYSRYFMIYISYVMLLVIALSMIYFSGHLDKIVVRVVLLLVAGGLVASVAFVVALNSRTHLDRLVYWLQRFIDGAAKLMRPRSKPLIGTARIRRLLNEFHDGYDLVWQERHRLGFPLMFALLANVLELTSFYLIFRALGTFIDPSLAILCYAIANTVGVISLVPGDFGVYEVTMVTALSVVGVPLAIALSATALYRIINRIPFLPIGFYYYGRFTKPVPNVPTNLKR